MLLSFLFFLLQFPLMETIYLVFIVGYGMILSWLMANWKKNRKAVASPPVQYSIALMVPFRNEMQNLPCLLRNLIKILPREVEVIFIDDESGDESADIILRFISKNRLDHWSCISSKGKGKKAALDSGIKFTEAEIILTTDADVCLPENWVGYMSAPFNDPHIQMVAGPVISEKGEGAFSAFQQIEWASILLVTGASFGLNKPLMCSGANLGYKREAFFQVGGFEGNEENPSGDDEFMLKKIINEFGPGSIKYLSQKEVLVKTKPQSGFYPLLQQRVRWAGKWRQHSQCSHAAAAIFGFMASLFHLSSIVLLFGPVYSQVTFVLFWIIKIGFEKKVLGKILAWYQFRFGIGYFIFASAYHPIYALAVGVGALEGNFTWKGRKNKIKL